VTGIILGLLAAVLAITLHEAAHGYAAWALGDDTAKRMGRLSLNPLAHVDRVGTILLPGALIAFQLLLPPHRIGFLFGWAKPVPVAAWKFRYPRQGMMLVAAAGPAMNFFLAWLGALAMHGADRLSEANAALAAEFLFSFILSNLVLGLFNLLPILPLDGGRIVAGLLPEAAARQWAKLERVGIAIVMLVVFLLPYALRDLAHIQFDPVGEALNHVLPKAVDLVLKLAGIDPDV
jgi:Zn-dependent protease